MDWRLRRCGPGDAPALAMVAAATFLETFAGIITGDDIVAHCVAKSSAGAFLDWIDDGASIVTLAEHPSGGAPIGYTVLTAPDLPIDTGPGDIELRRIYTLSLTRATGLGAMLMTRAIAETRTLGGKRLLLGVLGTNRQARAFYERHGFVLAGTRRFRVGQGWHDDVIYARAT